MAVRPQVNNYVSKLIELWHIGYDAQLVITCVDGHMGINLQQSLLACETVSHRYSQNEHHGRQPTQPQVRRRRRPHERHQQHPLPREQHPPSREQPAKRRRRVRRAFAREIVGKAAAQVPSSQHQVPVQPGATSHAPPAAAPSFLPPFLPPAELVWQDRHPPLRPLAGEEALLAGQAVESLQVVAEEAAEEAAFASPVLPPYASFSFHSPTDSPLHPPPSSSYPRRATLRRIRQKPSYIFLKIRKPARILKSVLNKNIVRGLWTIYLSEGHCEGIVDLVPFGGTL